MKNKNKIICAILAMVLLLSSAMVFPLTANGAGNGSVIEEGNYRAVYYQDGTAMLIEAKVKDEHITVPSKIGDYTITEIGGAYSGNTKIKSVTIPDTVTGILGCAFEDCKNLESVTMTDSVILIGGSAFSGCTSLKSIDISDNVTEISDEAFFMCNSLKEVTIPESVEAIGGLAFADCKNLATININKNPDLVIAGDAFSYTKWYKNQPEGVVYLDRFALCYKGDVPEGFKVEFKDGTTAVCNNMFYDSEFDEESTALAGVTFPDTLTYIGDNAFRKCVNLETVEFPESLSHIGNSAFEGCTSVKNITIPANVKDLRHSFSRSGLESLTLKCNPEMWSYAFYECENLKEINFAENLEIIDLASFFGCKALESVTIPDSVKVIDWASFMNCEKLADIKHSGNIYIVNNESFQNTAWENAQPDGFVCFGDVILYHKGNVAQSIEELIIEDGIKGVADGAFEDYENLKKVVFPEGFKAIGAYSFRGTKVESIVVPESVEFIGFNAFGNCSELSSLEIKGGGVIEYNAFFNCKNLKSVKISGDVEEIGKDAFGKYSTFKENGVVEGFVINGYEGSEAESYAKENGIEFVLLASSDELSPDTRILGDVNGDSKVNVKDATMIQKAVAKIIELTDAESSRADVNADGKINIKDATAIQKFVAKIETGLPIGTTIA